MEVLHFTIPLDPKGKKNSQNIVYTNGRPIIVQNAVYKTYESGCRKYIPKVDAPIDYPVNVECVFFRRERRTVDLTNLLAAIDDILVKYGVLLDDNRDIVSGHDGSRVYHDKDCPRTEVIITTAKGGYKQWKTEH